MARTRELRFERDLLTSAEEAWRWITEPERMNQWSEAKITGTGEDTREVRVRAFGFTSRLRETILGRDPPRRFVYQVKDHPTIRDHLGVQTLTPIESGTRLVWTVRFRGVLPPITPLLSAILEPGLGRSLDVLVRLAQAS